MNMETKKTATPGREESGARTNHDRAGPASGGVTRRAFLLSGTAAAVAGGLARGQEPVINRRPAGGKSVAGPQTGSYNRFAERSDPSAVFETIKREATPEQLYRFLYALPKGGDLHAHHGGSFLPEMLYAMATNPAKTGGIRYYTRVRINDCDERELHPYFRGSHRMMYFMTIRESFWRSLPRCNRDEFKPLDELTPEERSRWQSSIMLDRPFEGRDEFFQYHWSRIGHLFNDIELSANLLVENMKLFGAEGLLYIEPQLSYRGYTDGDGNPVSEHEAYLHFKERLQEPDARATGVTVRFGQTILRFNDDAPEEIDPTFRFIYEHNDLWRFINMAGREDDARGYPQRFTEAYDNALRKYPNVDIAIHAGESENPSTYIFDTLRLGATRIGHGINLIQDPETMMLMRCGRFLVEINLISNHLLKYVGDMDRHPFPIYLRQGIPCCLNTDDRGMWHSNMTDEYFVAVTRYNLSWEELVQLGRNSLAFSFLQEEPKDALLRRYEDNVSTFAKHFLQPAAWRAPLAAVNPVTYGYGKREFGLAL